MRNALTRVDGMALPDCLGGHVVNILFRKVFKEELELRSIDMVERVRSYMQSILQKLFQTACREFPSLLNEVKTSLVEEFMDFKQEQTVEAVLNVVKAELGWLFTQHRDYTTTNTNVQDMVRNERLSEAVCQAATQAGRSHRQDIIILSAAQGPKYIIILSRAQGPWVRCRKSSSRK